MILDEENIKKKTSLRDKGLFLHKNN